MKPAVPSKCYLSGMDWVIHTLDYTSTRRLGCEQSFQIVVELAEGLNAEQFRLHLTTYCEAIPHLWGSVHRAFNLAPYWRVAKPSGRPGVRMDLRQVVDLGEALNLFCRELNRPFERGEACLRSLVVTIPNKTLIGFVFDHRLFDARGAELFLEQFRCFVVDGSFKGNQGLNGSAGLNHWGEKFAAGKKINRAHLGPRGNSLVQRSMDGNRFAKRKNCFKVRSFDPIESQAIFERAEERVGTFMFSLYSLAVTIQTIQSLFRRRGTEEGDLTVAVTRDMRRENKSNLSIFFNHLSFLYFRVNSQDTGTIPVLVDTLKRQLYEQMKDRLPEALVESSMLMRIVPRFALAWGFARFLPASMPTFAFACLGESAYQGEKFAGSQVLNMFHMPRIPPSPGLGIFFSEFRKTLTMTLSYIEDAVSEEEATRLMSTVADQL